LRPQLPPGHEPITGRLVDARPVMDAIHPEPGMEAAAGQGVRGVEVVEHHAERYAVPRDALHVWNVGRSERECPRQVREAPAREALRLGQSGYGDALCAVRQLATSQLEA